MRRILTFAGMLLMLFWLPIARAESPESADRILLLVPDDASEADSRVSLWLDAASEEGLHITPVHDSEFIRPYLKTAACAGIILPDSIHKQVSDAFLAGI